MRNTLPYIDWETKCKNDLNSFFENREAKVKARETVNALMNRLYHLKKLVSVCADALLEDCAEQVSETLNNFVIPEIEAAETELKTL